MLQPSVVAYRASHARSARIATGASPTHHGTAHSLSLPFAVAAAGSALGQFLARLVRQRRQFSIRPGLRVRAKQYGAEYQGLALETLSASSDFTLTDGIIDCFRDDALFQKLARFEEDLLVKRDDQDAEMLKAGIQKGIEQGALRAPDSQPVYNDIDVNAMDADERAAYIASKLPPSTMGCVVILIGKSGTGKETTFKKLQKEPASATGE